MPKIVPIVEGPGEVDAVPSLLGKILAQMGRYDIQVALPRNALGRGNLTKPKLLEALIADCSNERGCGAILILMDADKDCPVKLAQNFSRRAQAMGPRHSVVTVIAKCEYEAWFLASLETMPGLPEGLIYPGDVEARVGVKGWLDQHFFPPGRAYKPTINQMPMTKRLDTALARERSRSFRRLWHGVEQALAAMDQGQIIVTPAH